MDTRTRRSNYLHRAGRSWEHDIAELFKKVSGFCGTQSFVTVVAGGDSEARQKNIIARSNATFIQ